MESITNKEQVIIDPVLSTILGYEFIDPSLLATALTHKSTPDKNKRSIHGHDNERLEFLGDAVLSLVTAHYLYKHKTFLSEGDLSRLRAQFVCKENLSKAAKQMGLADYIVSDKAMKSSGSTNSKSILSDTLEAILGAIFIDGGLKNAEEAIMRLLGEPPTKVHEQAVDAKSKLQELIQAENKTAPCYVLLNSQGPAHAPMFEVGVEVKGEIVASAFGENKKIAAQNAAAKALEKFLPPHPGVVS